LKFSLLSPSVSCYNHGLLLQHLFQQWDTSLGKGKYSISKTFNCKWSLIQEQSIASVLDMASLQRYYIGKFKLNEQADVHVLLNVHWALSTHGLHVLPSSDYTLVATSQIVPTWDGNPIRSIYEKPIIFPSPIREAADMNSHILGVISPTDIHNVDFVSYKPLNGNVKNVRSIILDAEH
jgi:hypothetical protein